MNLPLTKPLREPDFAGLRKALLRQGQPERVPFFDIYVDDEVMNAIVGGKPPDPNDPEAAWRKQIRFHHLAGYDYVRIDPVINLPLTNVLRDGKAAGSADRNRKWADEHKGVIETRADFERYPWPKPGEIDYAPVEFAARNAPDGMKVVSGTGIGVFENATLLMGQENLALALYDDPDLVGAVFDKLGELLVTVYTNLVQIDGVGAMRYDDDMGHRNGTLIAPEVLRERVFPWHKRVVDICHQRGLPVVLHSCGKLEKVMDDLIDTVGIDGKHSYEDNILPATEAKALYGDRLCIVGGVDVDKLCRMDEQPFRKYVGQILEQCAPGGGYCLGSGNSIANYVRIENYLAMLDEGLHFSGKR